MNECPFLTTYSESIECFEKCPFYEYEGEGCPFKQVYSDREKYTELQNSIEEKYSAYFDVEKLYVDSQKKII
ncbi:hypothetical protein SH2C18_21230 [Clostridium sediminicola]|uniref:hypothetical protein n=1 Tax=Clostridium sediminicola TaxID=3114879 RepID=UPI0031F1CE61